MGQDEREEGRAIIRPMRAADIEAVAQLEQQVFPNPWPISAYVEELLFTPKAHYFVLERPLPQTAPPLSLWGGHQVRLRRRWEVIGMVGMRIETVGEERRAHITTLAVHPAWRRQGWGRRLLRRAMEAARPYAPRRIVLEVRTTNETAMALYRSERFTIARRLRRYYRDGGDAYLMEKVLSEGEVPPGGQEDRAEEE